MKKILLLTGIVFAFTFSKAQIITFVENPPSLMGNLAFEWASPSGGWGTADLSILGNSVTDTLAFASDGTAADSLACNPLTNGAQITGKIAILYRGSCQFGSKALNAQNAGAVAVIIINNLPGAPVGMAPGTDGASVTIPTIMIGQSDGAMLRDSIMNGNVIVFIGNKAGFYADDIGFYPSDILMPQRTGNPALISSNAAELTVDLGGWVHNYGSNNQAAVTLNASIDLGGISLYNQTSSPVAILTGDSAYFTLPSFSQSSYTNGYYTVTYTADFGITDEFMNDNVRNANFVVSDSVFALARIDSTYLPTTTASYRPSASTGSFTSCIHFQDANASRLAALGVTFSASGGASGAMTNEYIQVFAYEWQDVFTGMSDPGLAVSNLVQVATGDYSYTADLPNEAVYAPFTSRLVMTDNIRYLFCVNTLTPEVYLGFDSGLDYDKNVNLYDQPITVIEDNGTWYAAGFGTDVTASIAVNMEDKLIGIEESTNNVEITPYPNPANNSITIPLDNLTGNANLEIVDVTGRVVSTQSVNLTAGTLQVDVSDLSNGAYVFNMKFEDGKSGRFNVIVNR